MMVQKIALVTGASRGIGFEICRQLKEKNIQVILTSRNAASGETAAKKLSEKNRSVRYCQLDITQQKSVDHAFDFVKREFGRLDILVNNAGIFVDRSPEKGAKEATSFFNSNIEVIRESLETNTFGAIRMIQRFVPLMRLHNYGRIVNISSGMGQLSEMEGRWPGYRISKTALNAVTRIVSAELQGTNILVNSVCPGWVKTDMGGPNAELTVEEGADTPVWLATLPDGSATGGFFRERQLIPW